MTVLTCSNGIESILSIEKLDDIAYLVIDFNIKEYKELIPGLGWTDFAFPSNIVINDKLYLDKIKTKEIISIFNSYLKHDNLTQVAEDRNIRGFSILDLSDSRGNKISIQDSSSIDSHIWFGCKVKNQDIYIVNNEELKPYVYPNVNNSDSRLISDRHHLTRKDVKEFKNAFKNEWKIFDNYEKLNKKIEKSVNKKITKKITSKI